MKPHKHSLTNLLQGLYDRRTTLPPASRLMRRCERNLAPVRPALPPWDGRSGADRTCAPDVNLRTNMKTLITKLTTLLLLGGRCLQPGYAATPPKSSAKAQAPTSTGLITFQQIAYDARLSDGEARFLVDVAIESTVQKETRAPFFEGELAIVPPKLPSGLRIERQDNHYDLVAT